MCSISAIALLSAFLENRAVDVFKEGAASQAPEFKRAFSFIASFMNSRSATIR